MDSQNARIFTELFLDFETAGPSGFTSGMPTTMLGICMTTPSGSGHSSSKAVIPIDQTTGTLDWDRGQYDIAPPAIDTPSSTWFREQLQFCLQGDPEDAGGSGSKTN